MRDLVFVVIFLRQASSPKQYQKYRADEGRCRLKLKKEWMSVAVIPANIPVERNNICLSDVFVLMDLKI